ncbi:MAG: hypothetical protein Q8L88_14015 [Bacteroidota bacterium]|nr:hypothetical protein [Bacteroidota bacterium]
MIQFNKKERIMKWFRVAFPFFAIIVCNEGCASITPVNLSMSQGSKTVSMTSNINKEYEVIKHFKVKQAVPFLFLFRLNPDGGQADLNELLAPELISSQADAVVNLSIKGDGDIKDVFLPVGLGLLSGIVISPVFYFVMTIPLFEDLKTYEVEGDLVKYISQTSLPEKTKELIDPLTGLPLQKQKIEYDPETGLPKKE